MFPKCLLSGLLAGVLFPAALSADENGVFVGLDLTGGFASGSSDTRNGGAFGNGVVGNVEFGETVGIGGHVGYRFSPAWSVSLSYQHVWGDVSWDAQYPSSTSRFEGTATSDVVLVRGSYDLFLSDATVASLTGGVGVSFNTLGEVVETDVGSGIFLADLEERTEINPAAQIGVGIRHQIASNAVFGLEAAIAYTGGFETGNTRTGNLGVTAITPYGIDDVWRASLGTSLRFGF